jgi:hypothetical protein
MQQNDNAALWWAGLVILAVLVGALIAIGASKAKAHSWYDWECCHEQDCKPVDQEEVEEIGGGKWLHKPTKQPFESVRPSKDGRFHACILYGKPKCLYIVMGT